MRPTTRRQRETRAAWLRNIALVLLPLIVLASAQCALLFHTLPVQLPAPAAPQAPAASGPAHTQNVHPRDTLKP